MENLVQVLTHKMYYEQFGKHKIIKTSIAPSLRRVEKKNLVRKRLVSQELQEKSFE